MIATGLMLCLVFVCGALYIGFRFLAFVERSGKAPSGIGTLSFTDVLTVWLTVLSIMVALASLVMTGAAVLLGVAAIIGYQGLKQEAQAHAQLFAAEYLKGKDFDERIKSSIGLGLKSWRSGTVSAEEPIEPIARPYPRKKKAGDKSDDKS